MLLRTLAVALVLAVPAANTRVVEVFGPHSGAKNDTVVEPTFERAS